MRSFFITRQKLSSLLIIFVSVLTGCSVLEQKPIDVGSGDIRITVPSTVKVMAVDTREVSSPSLYMGKYHLLLTPGTHTLLLRYEENWNSMEDSGHVIRSQPIEIRTEFTENTKYSLTHQKLDSRQAAENWVKDPQISLQSSAGNVGGKVIDGPVITTAADTDVVETMQSLWRAATPEERSRFRQWLQQQIAK